MFAMAGRPWTAVIGALAIGGAHAWVLAVEFMVLPWINRHDPAPPAPGSMLRAGMVGRGVRGARASSAGSSRGVRTAMPD